MKKHLIINGMISNHCKQRVELILNNIQGVNSAEVILDKKTAVIDFEGKFEKLIFESALEKGGYHLQEIRNPEEIQ